MKKKLTIGIICIVALICVLLFSIRLFNVTCSFKDGYVTIPQNTELSETDLKKLETLINDKNHIRLGEFKGIGDVQFEFICHDDGGFYAVTVTPDIAVIQSNRFSLHYRVITDQETVQKIKDILQSVQP